ncbi:RNA 2'-phosphotransferase [Paenibacillus sp. 481]|uniref:RNA 2'-phosphotransferase n=1 Tax=Paenibacillus sp. 481 TaxID=2835869 RepID=UPI001E359DC0|nr:RNA 2'-phosphotransferase [Paenibacillus sp. 481]UHA71897.1 RNA 2'-phosphotransferase [Paenibacillus sp. 481]
MLNKQLETSLSKFMTKLLRHTPTEYGLTLDPSDGSCLLQDVLRVIQAQPRWSTVTQEQVEQVVSQSDKQRFVIDGERIRARYGHSQQKVQYEPGTPPPMLYHGTNTNVVAIILKEGIRSMQRQYVHLSEGTHFATMAGSRRGELVLLTIDTTAARELGAVFYYAGNEVWLAEYIPPAAIKPLNNLQ